MPLRDTAIAVAIPADQHQQQLHRILFSYSYYLRYRIVSIEGYCIFPNISSLILFSSISDGTTLLTATIAAAISEASPMPETTGMMRSEE